ncbi:hypothetical protein [Pedobacter africanus]|uniref:hypothetical protein n=1 Tax=Pedobacter africanus TaxID=151894 RepID=UPI00339ADFF1
MVLLINKAYDHVTHPDSARGRAGHIQQHLLRKLTSTLAFLESHYPKAFDHDERVPVTRLVGVREEIATSTQAIREKLENGLNSSELMLEIKKKLEEGGNSPKLQDIILEVINDFIDKIDRGEHITTKEAQYHLQVVQDILNDDGQKTSMSNCPSLHELLIHWNVNSRKCIQYFTQGTDEMVKDLPTPGEKLEFFQQQLVNLHKIPDIPDFIYNPRLPSVKAHLTDYVNHEIDYLEKKIAGHYPMREQVPFVSNAPGAFRTLVKVSVDQLSLFIRALDDTRIIEAKSKSAIFKAVASATSTPGAPEPSWDNMRSKSYAVEERDKEVVLEILGTLAEKIRSY